MDAGQAGLAVLGDVYRFALLELHGAGGADLSADAAANAGIRDPDKKRRRAALWHLPDAAQKLLMRSTIRLRDGCNLILSRCQIFLDQHDFGILLLVQLYLLIHIERGQPVVNHLNNVNIVDADAAFLAEQLCQLRSTAMAVPVGENHVEVIGMENSIVQKIPHHMGNLMLIDRGYDADGISGELQGFLSNDLGNTDEVLFQMLCNI